MKLVLQRVAFASVTVEEKEIARIGRGLLVLICAEKGDHEDCLLYFVDKTVNLRIFPDEQGRMNRSCHDISGEVLVVSQFTLAGDCRKGRRPGFDRAEAPDIAEKLYLRYVELLKESGLKVQQGEFAADMKVELLNDGPVTFILED
jgi:D-tyrosyl-tRNA(Tyr) deacylase